jgi:hypothetical protein
MCVTSQGKHCMHGIEENLQRRQSLLSVNDNPRLQIPDRILDLLNHNCAQEVRLHRLRSDC